MSADHPGLTARPGIYVHIPFCRSKCDYCAFVSLPCRRPPGSYLKAVLAQARQLAELPWSREQLFGSLFIGGGTPTIYPPEQLAELIGELFRLFRFSSEGDEPPEISLESNPNTLSREGLRRLRAAGVNRLSIGVQSFDDQLLQAVGRGHDRAAALAAIAWAREAGFENFNLDLIYGLPGQTAERFRADLTTAMEAEPTHLAIYQLTPEEGTPLVGRLAAGEQTLPDDDQCAAMEELARKLLGAMVYEQYEVANYCQPGYQCRHNLNYWRNGSYLGLGAAAFSCLDGLRIGNVRAPGLYRRLLAAGQAPYATAEALGREAAFRETVIMGLRLTEGVEIAELQRRFALTPQAYYGTMLTRLLDLGLLTLEGGRLALSERAFPLANQVLSQLV
ncbi:radical SAM family heme chaperone HemW [Desulfurivibrio sp. D14AmB]|uniref:radical SAM family heme chaperone HemW n=1 Tax=Desulfurivibrio sp. D14AmB TaxID=3374370 RepID=UPI00376EF5E0